MRSLTRIQSASFLIGILLSMKLTSVKKLSEYARALEIGERYGIMILTRYCGWPEEKAQAVVRHLVKQYPHHGFIIDYDELKMLGLNVEHVNEDNVQIIGEIGTFLLKTSETKIKLYEPSNTTSPAMEQQTGSKEVAAE